MGRLSVPAPRYASKLGKFGNGGNFFVAFFFHRAMYFLDRSRHLK
jgi:hypothetical protein